ncbi:hypothetical protein EI94DRAFT_1731445 [Lactarius quietus]|nr:hypothetical protein EI94DRAFT_1731445 [Lactarius quietus]
MIHRFYFCLSLACLRFELSPYSYLVNSPLSCPLACWLAVSRLAKPAICMFLSVGRQSPPDLPMLFDFPSRFETVMVCTGLGRRLVTFRDFLFVILGTEGRCFTQWTDLRISAFHGFDLLSKDNFKLSQRRTAFFSGGIYPSPRLTHVPASPNIPYRRGRTR